MHASLGACASVPLPVLHSTEILVTWEPAEVHLTKRRLQNALTLLVEMCSVDSCSRQMNMALGESAALQTAVCKRLLATNSRSVQLLLEHSAPKRLLLPTFQY